MIVPSPVLHIVPFDSAVHDVTAITDLLHRAYRPLAEAGMRYMATHQGPDITLARLTSGYGFVAFLDGAMIGTVTVYEPAPDSPCLRYRQPRTWHFGQFAVDPDLQASGLGSSMMEFVERFAAERGAQELALDTSEHAHGLIAFYTKRAYAIVDGVTWSDVNYTSVVMAKALGL